jgi:dynactin complex subunit
VTTLDSKLNKLDGKLTSVEGKLSSVIVEVTSNGRKLDQLVTKKEFNEFKDQTLTHFDGLSKQIEDLQEERALAAA